ncbi:MAG: SusC/RagA family TonB-linked outer membrane protein [Bacteroidales bacterium]
MKKIIFLTGLLICLLPFASRVNAQNPVIIKGTVTDSMTTESMIQVNIVEMDKNGRYVSGTVTDVNGNYTLRVSNDKNMIQVSFIGYKKQTFLVNGRTTINIALESESQTLNEVRVEGVKMSNDGFTKVRDRATAVARIELKDMKSVMSTSVEDMLQGRIGNVDISSVSGDPGAGLNIRIRGTASLNARNNPLIVINGIPYDTEIDESFDFASADVEKFGNLIDVPPEDIESIEVLKDAASTAAWGSKASNGVLMIKTKRGTKSRPIFEYTFKTTTAREPDPIPMLNGREYAALITMEHYADNRNEYSNREISFSRDLLDEDYYNYTQNTNWIKEITQVALTNEHNFSVRGGGEKTKYNMAVGFFDEGGTTIGNELKKLNLRSSLDYDLSSKLQFKTDIMFTRYDQDATYDVEDSEFGYKLVRSIAYRKMPNLSVYDRDTNNIPSNEYFTPVNTIQGTAREIYNPVAFANLGTQKRLRDNSRALFSIRYSILPRLIFNSTVTLDIFDNKVSKFLPFKAIGFNYTDDITNRGVNEFYKKSSIYTINQLVFTPDLGPDHDLAVMGQFDTEETQSRWFKTETSQSASPDMQEPIGDKHLVYFGADFSRYRSMGMFLTATYKLKDKYIMMLGAKYEGNSRFSKESRWGLFPTLSAAWRISEEAFLKNASFINDLKLRFSWGQVVQSLSNYLAYTTYTAGAAYNYLDFAGVRPNGPELTSLKWETIDQVNPGLSFFGFDNHMNIEIDYYRKKTLNLYLQSSGIPSTSGFTSISRNEGEMENRGYEFMIDYAIVKRRDLEISFNLNLSRNDNIVIRLPENYSLESGDMLANGQYKISVTPGEALGGFFGYRYLGVYSYDADAVVRDKDGNPVYGVNKDAPLTMIMGGTSGYEFEGGDAIYQDVNYDGQIDELDVVYLGDLNPDYMGGFGNRFMYKGFILNSFFYFKVGQKIINQTRMDTEKMYWHDNQSKATNWRWRSEGDVTDMPKALYGKGYNWLGSDRFVEDGSYLRLKTLSLSYMVPEKYCKIVKLKEMKVYGTAYNLYTWTHYSGQDPDVAAPSNPSNLPKDYSRTPPSRKFMLGVNITF